MSWPQWMLDETELGDRAAHALAEEQIPTGDEFIERYALESLMTDAPGSLIATHRSPRRAEQ